MHVDTSFMPVAAVNVRSSDKLSCVRQGVEQAFQDCAMANAVLTATAIRMDFWFGPIETA
jgi:hypothetical protein